MSFIKHLNEISSSLVDVQYIYQEYGEWFGSFEIDNIEYDIVFRREDKPRNLDIKIASLKFSRPDLDDPHAFSKDFKKPLVVANTVKQELKKYLEKEPCDVFIFKSYIGEKSRVKKYRDLANSLIFGFFSMLWEVEFQKYNYFILYKKTSFFKNNKEIEQFAKDNI
jgi:hypothetical protein